MDFYLYSIQSRFQWAYAGAFPLSFLESLSVCYFTLAICFRRHPIYLNFMGTLPT
jgi:hypothetical protein